MITKEEKKERRQTKRELLKAIVKKHFSIEYRLMSRPSQARASARMIADQLIAGKNPLHIERLPEREPTPAAVVAESAQGNESTVTVDAVNGATDAHPIQIAMPDAGDDIAQAICAAHPAIESQSAEIVQNADSVQNPENSPQQGVDHGPHGRDVKPPRVGGPRMVAIVGDGAGYGQGIGADVVEIQRRFNATEAEQSRDAEPKVSKTLPPQPTRAELIALRKYVGTVPLSPAAGKTRRERRARNAQLARLGLVSSTINSYGLRERGIVGDINGIFSDEIFSDDALAKVATA